MAILPKVECPKCGQLLESEEFTPSGKDGRAKTASGFSSCLRRCLICGVGLSNANTGEATSLTRIYRDPIPKEVMEYLEEVIGQAINTRNRPKKREKLESENSEDAVTWTIFRYLQKEQMLADVLSALGVITLADGQQEPTLLLWGAATPPSDPAGQDVTRQVVNTSDAIGENHASRSEPDVILDFGEQGLCVIEVKLRSKNDQKPADYPHWAMYFKDTDAFADEGQVRESGCYELARNWRIGCDLAGARPFTLVNLAGPSLFADKSEQDRLRRFQDGLAEKEGRTFLELAWDDMLQQIPAPCPPWLKDFINKRRVGE